TGTGKELFAQSIHNASQRSTKPFISQNCAALPETLIESILFGTKKGAFTGAIDKPGLFEEANGGTLLLDEINSLSPNLQAKLLRV
ncbi:sigma-54-dependent Fis family transcriptional regulator, partial [Pseudomonas sp. GP01-A3]